MPNVSTDVSLALAFRGRANSSVFDALDFDILHSHQSRIDNRHRRLNSPASSAGGVRRVRDNIRNQIGGRRRGVDSR